MGSAASKPARRLGATATSKITPAPSSVGASSAGSRGTPQAPPAGSTGADEGHSFEKSQGTWAPLTLAIKDDALDPQFLRNLEAIGPLHSTRVFSMEQTQSPMVGILEARAQQAPATDNSDLPPMTAHDMVQLLETYQAAPRPETLERLAVEYDLPLPLLEKVVRYVRVPSEQPVA